MVKAYNDFTVENLPMRAKLRPYKILKITSITLLHKRVSGVNS